MSKFYYATSDDGLRSFNRTQIIHRTNEGLLLHSSIEEARKHGRILIEVEYNPLERAWSNTWKESVQSHKEYMPIPGKLCKVLT